MSTNGIAKKFLELFLDKYIDKYLVVYYMLVRFKKSCWVVVAAMAINKFFFIIANNGNGVLGGLKLEFSQSKVQIMKHNNL